ncbi:HypC/HybG/HupF family hydrogenase formation chaperone [uncultured Aquitalea sp.]|uniref:HypC/HybG/HupF family hydrogenase formation chaperone n=1 Tax=uncultured Aquitalea sp. TaxID=540272 RepID=UPI0025EED679|nr:HypC/HybG/HupF family hydrogenase formation chaperone [uncultured Aquitalea sp.]
MCLGIPMQVIAADGLMAECLHRGETEKIDLSLTGPAQTGDWLLVFAGAAREALSPAQAADILEALTALEAAMNGRFDPDVHLADLTRREPQLPPHLQAQLEAGRKTH